LYHPALFVQQGRLFRSGTAIGFDGLGCAENRVRCFAEEVLTKIRNE